MNKQKIILTLLTLCFSIFGFSQCKGDCDNGDCEITYTNAVYKGKCKNSQCHGYGTLVFNKNNEKYEGDWINGKKHGYGTYYYDDGTEWTGEWIDDEKGEGHYNNENYYNPKDIIGSTNWTIIKLDELIDVDGQGCFNIVLDFNGVKQDFLFDTGCSSFLINQEFLEVLKKKGFVVRQLQSGFGSTAANQTILMEQYVIEKITIGEYTVNNLVIDVHDNGSLLLGMGFLNKFSNVEWNKKDNTLKLYK